MEPRTPTDQFANVLYLGAGVLLVYALLAWVVSLPVFALHRLVVQGELRHVSEDNIKLVADRRLRGNFFTVDLGQVRAEFEKLPWVSEARVSRHWPDRLIVDLVEHTPLARWNGSELVSMKGDVFSASVNAELPSLGGFEGSGREVADAYRRYSEILSPLGLHIAELNYSTRRAWRLKTDSGLEIALGRMDAEQRLQRFAAHYQETLERLGAAPSYVDLRYADGFAVKLPRSAQKMNKQS